LLPAPDGEALAVNVRREGSVIKVQVRGAGKPWRLLLRGINAVAAVDGGAAHDDALGSMIVPEQGAVDLTIHYRYSFHCILACTIGQDTMKTHFGHSTGFLQ
jgi:hypothetical protein